MPQEILEKLGDAMLGTLMEEMQSLVIGVAHRIVRIQEQGPATAHGHLTEIIVFGGWSDPHDFIYFDEKSTAFAKPILAHSLHAEYCRYRHVFLEGGPVAMPGLHVFRFHILMP